MREKEKEKKMKEKERQRCVAGRKLEHPASSLPSALVESGDV